MLHAVNALTDEVTTLLMVTHEVNFARKLAARVVLKHAGRIDEMGLPTAMLGDPQTAGLKQSVLALY